MREFKNIEEVSDFWNRRGGSHIRKKHKYRSKKFSDEVIYTKHGPEYVPAIINTVRKHSPKVFIELGTFMGGLTLALHEEFPKMKIFTFDVFIDIDVRKKELLFNDNVRFVEDDLLNTMSTYLVSLLKSIRRKKMLYCDNGNKEYEINTYSEYLLPGDALGCHDWLFEVLPKNVENTLRWFRPFDRETYLNNKETLCSRFWVKKRKMRKYLSKKDLRRDIFILVIGHGRTGTNLCAGLLNSSYNLRLGLEINNRWVHVEESESLSRSSILRKAVSHPERTISYNYNGNKVVLGHRSSSDYFKFFCEKSIYVLHDNYEELKIIFTKRHPVSTVVSQYNRLGERRPDILVDSLVDKHITTMKIVEEMKSFFIDYYIFDFDKVVEDGYLAESMFDFVGEEFFYEYVSEYRGIGNYDHAIGIHPENVLFGREDLFPDLRAEITEAFIKRGIDIK